MDQQEMVTLVEHTPEGGGAGDVDGCVAAYTDDIVHDAGGCTGSPRTGKDAAREFYRALSANFRTEGEEPSTGSSMPTTMILEQNMTGAFIGEMIGIPGRGTASDLRDPARLRLPRRTDQPRTGLGDTGAIAAQLSAP